MELVELLIMDPRTDISQFGLSDPNSLNCCLKSHLISNPSPKMMNILRRRLKLDDVINKQLVISEVSMESRVRYINTYALLKYINK